MLMRIGLIEQRAILDGMKLFPTDSREMIASCIAICAALEAADGEIEDVVLRNAMLHMIAAIPHWIDPEEVMGGVPVLPEVVTLTHAISLVAWLLAEAEHEGAFITPDDHEEYPPLQGNVLRSDAQIVADFLAGVPPSEWPDADLLNTVLADWMGEIEASRVFESDTLSVSCCQIRHVLQAAYYHQREAGVRSADETVMRACADMLNRFMVTQREDVG